MGCAARRERWRTHPVATDHSASVSRARTWPCPRMFGPLRADRVESYLGAGPDCVTTRWRPPPSALRPRGPDENLIDADQQWCCFRFSERDIVDFGTRIDDAGLNFSVRPGRCRIAERMPCRDERVRRAFAARAFVSARLAR